MSYDRLHAVTFDLLYGALALLTFVVLERVLYFAYLSRRASRVRQALETDAFDPAVAARDLAARDVVTRSVAEYLRYQSAAASTRSRVDDLSNALFLRVDGALHARLWIVDTLVTAAPLLGLLGTILGIMQTFTALAAGGVSDPAEVSRGIGTALIATAIGIGTALYGLVGLNALNRFAEHLNDCFKTFLLRATL